jgi:hypothetical protein
VRPHRPSVVGTVVHDPAAHRALDLPEPVQRVRLSLPGQVGGDVGREPLEELTDLFVRGPEIAPGGRGRQLVEPPAHVFRQERLDQPDRPGLPVTGEKRKKARQHQLSSRIWRSSRGSAGLFLIPMIYLWLLYDNVV